ncbi:hypothetical protein P885DRAFT_72655 [Corynascus similis CBS 632.67]
MTQSSGHCRPYETGLHPDPRIPRWPQQLPPPKQLLELRSREDIYFLHPGYDSHNTLLCLPRVDSTTSTYGVHHRTALLACQIIAGNAFMNSYLAFDKADKQYYFIVEASELYPIVPSFQDWEFPHGRIPNWWPSVITASLSTMDCGITNADPSDIDNRANILPLRKDIHYAFDARWFVIIPRIVTTNPSLQPSPQYVTHIISPNAAELWPTYHTTLLFVIAGRRRHVIRISRDEAGNIEYKTEYCTGTELENLYGSGGSKAATPLYSRKSGRGSTAYDEASFAESSGDSDIDMEDTDSVWEMLSNSRERESNRRQESSEETATDTKVQLAPNIEADLRAALRKSMS